MSVAEHPARKLAAILHADVVGSTSLVQRNETLAHLRIQEAFRRFSSTIESYNGLTHEIRGDALVAEFSRASDAIAAALMFQLDHTNANSRLDDDLQPCVRVGVSLGEVVIADSAVTGAGVVLAQRVEQLADPGGVCVTGAIREAVPEHLPIDYSDLGKQCVKGFEEPVQVYSASMKVGTQMPAPPPAAPEKSKRGRSRRWKRWMTAGAVALLILAGGTLGVWRPWQPYFVPAAVERMEYPLPDKPSIAVLAFDNLSQDPEHESLSDAVSDNITTALSHFSELFVIARNSSFAYKGTPVNVQRVAEELGVRYVLEGSLQRSSDRVRVNVQLIDALAGNHVWAQVYDRRLEDIFEIQDEIARTVAATVEETIEVRERDRVMAAHPASLAAFEYWLRGTKHWFQWTEDGNDKAQIMYNKAVELDPKMARGYLGLAWVYLNGFSHGWTELPRAEALERARMYAQKGLELAPYDYFPHQTMGYVHMQAGELSQAIVRQERALELNPNAGYAMMDLGETLVYSGRALEAISWMEKAMRLNPHHPDWFYWNLGWAQYAAGHYEEALDTMSKMTAMPNRARRTLAAAYVRLGRLDEARAVVKTFLENSPDYSIATLRLNLAGKYEDPEAAERFIEDLRQAGLPER